ncbi:Two pore calcium channel protein 1 isoform X3 [Oopsacas minuta]|uniref:Two pore calcium channel protein 1 isoform X3 n=1 Tax=Oopsacas minuta TaxID=111878 RepID=A0AAV7JYN0_9METZ|nr:Two pore calcium channel protein 1 isoform X3 [Oopsacas minuta]
MTFRLDKSYRINEWSLNQPVPLSSNFNDDVAPSPINQEDDVLANSLDLPSLRFDSEESCGIPVGMRVDRVRVNSIEDEYLYVDNYEVKGKSIFPKTEKHQNSRIENIALYVHQSQNYFNPKYQPWSKNGKRAYDIIYHPIVYYFDLLMCVLLLLLTCFEPPLTELFLPHESEFFIITSILESILIVYFVIDLVLRYSWLGAKRFLRHQTTFLRLIGVIFVTIDFILALTIPSYCDNRLLRVFRPIIFLTSHRNRNIRSVMKQLFNSIRSILDLYILYIFYVSIFSFLTYHLMWGYDSDDFSSFSDTFITIFELSTKVNFPGIMLPSLEQNILVSLAFIPFLTFGVYVLTNILLAVVKDHFNKLEKERLKILLEYRRTCLQRAYNLGTQFSPSGWDYSLFRRVMVSLTKTISEKQCLLMFKVLDRHNNQNLSWKEFKQLSNVLSMKWRRSDLTNLSKVWHNMIQILRLRRLSTYAFLLVSSELFQFFMNSVIFINFIGIFCGTIIYHNPTDLINDHKIVYWAIVFLPFYIFEFSSQILGFGPFYYFTEKWYFWDFVILVCTILLSFLSLFPTPYEVQFVTFLIVIRTLHLLRILNARKSFRRLFSIIVLSIPDLMRFFLSLFLAFYVYAIIGMFLYAGKLKSCSFNSRGIPQLNSKCGKMYDLQSEPQGLYYLINFDDIFYSFITLFILMTGKSWSTIADGFVAVTSVYSYLFFIFYYLFVVLIVTNVAAAFVLELYKKLSTTLGDSYTVIVSISKKMMKKYKFDEDVGTDEMIYVGKRSLSQIDSLMVLYQSEDWIQKDEISPIGDFYVSN